MARQSLQKHLLVLNAITLSTKDFLETGGPVIAGLRSSLRHLPTVIIVQGRYDVVCPMVSAWELHQALPQSELKVIADAGHCRYRAWDSECVDRGHRSVCKQWIDRWDSHAAPRVRHCPQRVLAIDTQSDCSYRDSFRLLCREWPDGLMSEK